MKVQIMHGLGNHLTIDGIGCDKIRLEDQKLIYDLLENLPEKIGLRKIIKPKVVYHEAKNSLESGVTGFVILAESHISIHTYPKKGFMALDIFSVKEFDVDDMVEYIKGLFKAKEVDTNLIKREYNGR